MNVRYQLKPHDETVQTRFGTQKHEQKSYLRTNPSIVRIFSRTRKYKNRVTFPLTWYLRVKKSVKYYVSPNNQWILLGLFLDVDCTQAT